MNWNEEIKKSLGGCGEDVYIGQNVIFTSPEKVFLGNKVRIDPFTLITTGLITGDYVRLCSHVALIGGPNLTVRMGNWSFVAYGSKLLCASEDQSGDYGPPGGWWSSNLNQEGDIVLKDFSGVSSGCIVNPGAVIPEGCTIGALSFVYHPEILQEWSIFFGNPLHFHKKRNKEKILASVKDPKFLKTVK